MERRGFDYILRKDLDLSGEVGGGHPGRGNEVNKSCKRVQGR
jgi:hypothetical protein